MKHCALNSNSKTAKHADEKGDFILFLPVQGIYLFL